MHNDIKRIPTIRCLLVDDEPPAIRLVSSYIQQVPGLEIVAACNSAIEAFNILQKQKIDLIFLDIKMPKLAGTDFIQSLPNPPKVIFITAYREYAVDGFEMDVVDYLVKPVSLTRFMKAIAKVNRLLAIENYTTAPERQVNEDKEPFLYLKVDREMSKILLHEIIVVESKKEYSKLYLENNKQLLVKQSISSLGSLLSLHRFLRVHRSYIVAIEKINSFTSLHVNVGTYKIPIGRLYKNEVDKRLKN